MSGGSAAGHRVAPVDSVHAGISAARNGGDTAGQVAGHVKAGIGDVMVVKDAIARAYNHRWGRDIREAQARRPVGVVGFHQRVGKIAVGALRRRIDRRYLVGLNPAHVDALVRVIAVALAHKDGPLVLRLRPRNGGTYGRIVGDHVHVELLAQGVVPGWSQFIPQAGLDGKPGRDLKVVVDECGFIIAHVIGLRDLHRICR